MHKNIHENTSWWLSTIYKEQCQEVVNGEVEFRQYENKKLF